MKLLYNEIREPFELQNEGQKIFGVMQRPATDQKVPVVLYCHGLGGHKVGKYRMYVNFAEMLAKVGIASCRFDFRGSGDSEGDFAKMSLTGEISDTLIALDYLSKNPRVDTTRIGIFGRSFGGAIAILAASKFKNIKSIALWAPVFNAAQWEKKWALFESHGMAEAESQELMRINGQLPSLDFYKELFTMNLDSALDKLKDIPMLNIHGIQDPIVNFEHAIFYEEARKKSPAKSKFIRLQHSDHDFTHPEERLQAFAITKDWFVETL